MSKFSLIDKDRINSEVADHFFNDGRHQNQTTKFSSPLGVNIDQRNYSNETAIVESSIARNPHLASSKRAKTDLFGTIERTQMDFTNKIQSGVENLHMKMNTPIRKNCNNVYFNHIGENKMQEQFTNMKNFLYDEKINSRK
jgi:hypothetical protein